MAFPLHAEVFYFKTYAGACHAGVDKYFGSFPGCGGHAFRGFGVGTEILAGIRKAWPENRPQVAPVGITKGRVLVARRICYWDGRTAQALRSAATADPSTTLRSGRDDKGRAVTHLGSCYSDGESFDGCSFRPELTVWQASLLETTKLWHPDRLCPLDRIEIES